MQPINFSTTFENVPISTMSDSDSGTSIAGQAFEIAKLPVQALIASAKFLDQIAQGIVAVKDQPIMVVMKEGVKVINEAYDDVFRKE